MPSAQGLSVLAVLVWNLLVYQGTILLTRSRTAMDMTTCLDRMIPVAPVWVVIYLGTFAFWVVNYVLLARREGWFQVMAGEVTVKLLCGICFLAIPTTNIRPELTGSDVFSWVLGAVYWIDPPADLFPSIHCMDSWICALALLPHRDLPKWYRGLAVVLALLICASTLFTYQHVLADVAAGLLLGTLAIPLGKKLPLAGKLEKWFTALDRRLLGNAKER